MFINLKMNLDKIPIWIWHDEKNYQYWVVYTIAITSPLWKGEWLIGGESILECHVWKPY